MKLGTILSKTHPKSQESHSLSDSTSNFKNVTSPTSPTPKGMGDHITPILSDDGSIKPWNSNRRLKSKRSTSNNSYDRKDTHVSYENNVLNIVDFHDKANILLKE